MRIIPKSGLALKIILLIFSSMLLIFTIIFFFNYRISKSMIEKNLTENARNLTYSTVNKIERILVSVSKISDNLSKVLESREYSDADAKEFLRMMVENNSEIHGQGLFFEPYYFHPNSLYYGPYYYKMDGKLEMTYLGSHTYQYFTMDWYQIPEELERPVWSEPYFDEGGGNVVMTTYSVPLYKTINGSKKFIGVLGTDISLEWLHDIIGSIEIYETGYAFIISRNGTLVTHPVKDLIMNETIFSLAEENKTPVLREIGRNMVRGDTSFAEIEYTNVATGKKSWISYAPIGNGWSLGIVYPVDEFLADVNYLNRIVLTLAVAGGVFLLFVIILIVRSITSSLRRLAHATLEFGEGNYNVTLPDIKSKDEIGDLNRSFIKMQNALAKTISQLKTANDELEEYSKTLEEKVENRTIMLKEKNEQLNAAFGNVKTLSEIGQKITSTLDLKLIFSTVYDSVNSLLDASVLMILIYDKENNQLNCKLSIEKGEKLPEFSFSMDDENRFAVWCVKNRKPVYMNDVDTEYSRYISKRVKPKAGDYSCSMIYFPLVVEERVIGAISVQSFKKNAYTQFNFDMMNSIATYTAIALDNAYAYETINKAHKDLKDAQSQLVQAEKMASLGQLTAGIAHEIKNPLNFVNNFSELSIDLAKEIRNELDKNKNVFVTEDLDYLNEILTDLENNVRKINDHGKRADSIVKGMLLHSRGKAGELQKTDINNLLVEYVNLAYHGFRAQDSSFNVKIEANYDSTVGMINVVPQNLSRVFLNIINNACYSVHEKRKEKGEKYTPVLCISTSSVNEKVQVKIKDNGKGIPKEIMEKIYNPFFTTKPAGKGTGLGLSLSFDIIVQEHKGEIKVQSEEGEYAEFTITIPKNL
jgi:signal transduction histidine kinase/HAMP domain-containing protein